MAAGAAGVAVLSAVGPGAAERAPTVTPVLTASARGNLRVSATHDGQPVIVAQDLVPGARRGANIRLRNRGARPVKLALVRRRLADSPGPGGGVLSDRVRVKLKRYVRRHGRLRKKKVFQRRVARMPRRPLGRLNAHRSRRFRLSLRMPDGGTPSGPRLGDNAYQGSAMSVDFVWQAEPARGR